jgi:hypothetical protein
MATISIWQRAARMPHMLETVRRPGAPKPDTFGAMESLIAFSFVALCDTVESARWSNCRACGQAAPRFPIPE